MLRARSIWPSLPTCCLSCKGDCRSGWNCRRCRRADLRRILTEPEHSLLKQYAALLDTEKVTLDFRDDAVDALADLASDINDRVENIGARRLHTVLERLLEDISFTATDRSGETFVVDAAYVAEKVAPLAQKGDLSRFIL